MSSEAPLARATARAEDEVASSGEKIATLAAVLTLAAALAFPWVGATGDRSTPVSLAPQGLTLGVIVVLVACLVAAVMAIGVVRRRAGRAVRHGLTLLAGLVVLGVLVYRHPEVSGPHTVDGKVLTFSPGLAYLVAALGGTLVAAAGGVMLLGWLLRRLREPALLRRLALAQSASDLEPDRPLLAVRGLKTHFHVMDGTVRAVDGVDFEIPRGGTVGLVGESGCGKSVTALSIMRLIDCPPGEFAGGEIWFEGRDLLTLDGDQIRAVRGKDIAMIFQEPMTSLNPVFTIGDQIAEAVLLHNDVSRHEALDRAIESLRLVGVSAPERRVKQYPHELSGGMRQRAMIAMALSCNPKLLIADEPTTALDVTIQAQILELIKEIQVKTGTALLLITHDLAVVAETVETVAVMYAGVIVESGSVKDVLLVPQHPYTQGLLGSIPAVRKRGQALSVITGVVPNPFRMPPGCKFEPRCPYAWERCREAEPELLPTPSGALSRCFLHAPEGAARRPAFEASAAATTARMVG